MAKIKTGPTYDEVIRAGVGKIGAFVDSADGRMPPVIEKMWNEVPREVQLFLQRPDPKEVKVKALLAVTFAQARRWREQEDPEAKKRVMEKIHAKIEQLRKEEKERRAKGKGSFNIDTSFDWLIEWQTVPELRMALGMSDEGLRKLMSRLKIKLVKCPNKKRGHDFIFRGDAMKCLDSRLQRKRVSGRSKCTRLVDSKCATLEG